MKFRSSALLRPYYVTLFPHVFAPAEPVTVPKCNSYDAIPPPPKALTRTPRRQIRRDPIYLGRLNQQPGKDGRQFAREG